MTIHFYLREEEKHITTFYEMGSNPFKVGDVINLSVDEAFPSKTLPSDAIKVVIEDSDLLRSTFHLKEVKIVSEYKEIRFGTLKQPTLIIEYFCEIQ